MTRKTQHDYTLADELFAKGHPGISRTGFMRRIARATGISWSTLYARYFTNKWRMRRVMHDEVKVVEPQRLNYLAQLNALKTRIFQETGIVDFRSEEGQAALAQFQLGPQYVQHHSIDESIWGDGAE